MRKLNLELDDLSVETFETSSFTEERGTVRGYDTGEVLCGESDVVSCGGSCYVTHCGNPSCFQAGCTGGGETDMSCVHSGPAAHETCCFAEC
jgi:hypothetical protein